MWRGQEGLVTGEEIRHAKTFPSESPIPELLPVWIWSHCTLCRTGSHTSVGFNQMCIYISYYIWSGWVNLLDKPHRIIYRVPSKDSVQRRHDTSCLCSADEGQGRSSSDVFDIWLGSRAVREWIKCWGLWLWYLCSLIWSPWGYWLGVA